MSALGVDKVLALNEPTKLNDAPITDAGTLGFYLPSHRNAAADFSVKFQAVPGGGAVTTLTASLQTAVDRATFTDDVLAAALYDATGERILATQLRGTNGRYGAAFDEIRLEPGDYVLTFFSAPQRAHQADMRILMLDCCPQAPRAPSSMNC